MEETPQFTKVDSSILQRKQALVTLTLIRND